MEIETRHGIAEAHVDAPDAPWFRMIVTHGSGGGVDTADVCAVRDAVLAIGGVVARVLQPYRVAGRRAPGSADRQDEAWLDLLAVLSTDRLPLVVAGRSNGARTACRTAAVVGARAVVALAFPLHPPGRPERTRVEELRAASRGGADVLVVNGDRDAFGVPDAADATEVRVLPGERHALGKAPDVVGRTVAEWLTETIGQDHPK